MTLWPKRPPERAVLLIDIKGAIDFVAAGQLAKGLGHAAGIFEGKSRARPRIPICCRVLPANCGTGQKGRQMGQTVACEELEEEIKKLRAELETLRSRLNRIEDAQATGAGLRAKASRQSSATRRST